MSGEAFLSKAAASMSSARIKRKFGYRVPSDKPRPGSQSTLGLTPAHHS